MRQLTRWAHMLVRWAKVLTGKSYYHQSQQLGKAFWLAFRDENARDPFGLSLVILKFHLASPFYHDLHRDRWIWCQRLGKTESKLSSLKGFKSWENLVR